MSDPQQSVWPDGAREAVQAAHDNWMNRPASDPTSVDEDILAALEPFVQQRIEQSAASIRHLINDAHDDGYADGLRDGSAADINVFRAALDEIDEMVPPAIGIYQTIPDRVRLVIDQRDESEEDVRLYREEADRLRAEVARLREDGERLDWLERQGANAITTRAAIDAARSAPGGEG